MATIIQSILNKPITKKDETIWYSIGTLTYSAASVLLLIIVTRILGNTSSGVFSIGWAICQQMFAVGLFGTRNFQVADLEERFSPSYYFRSKILTIFSMIVGGIAYGMVLQLDQDKMIVATCLTLLMASEVVADVFAGFFQQHGRLDIAGKSYFVRVISYNIIFTVCLVFTRNLFLSILLMSLFSFAWLFLFDYQIIKQIGYSKTKISFRKTLMLLGNCAPIFISAFLTNYIVNIPKNSIELLLTDQIQAAYNIIFMPSAIITLFLSFVLVPMYTSISKSWADKDTELLRKRIMLILTIIFILSLAILILGYFLGIPVLSFVYGINLQKYKLPFLILLLAGGINSLVNFLVFLQTVFQKQFLLLYIYGFVSLIASYYSIALIKKLEVLGAALSYLFSISFIALLLVLVTFYSYKKMKGSQL